MLHLQILLLLTLEISTEAHRHLSFRTKRTRCITGFGLRRMEWELGNGRNVEKESGTEPGFGTKTRWLAEERGPFSILAII